MLSLTRHRHWALRSRLARALLVLVALGWMLAGASTWEVHSHAVDDLDAVHHASDHGHGHAHDSGSAADAEDDTLITHAHAAPGGSVDLPADAGSAWPSPALPAWLPPFSAAAPPQAEQSPPHRPPIG